MPDSSPHSEPTSDPIEWLRWFINMPVRAGGELTPTEMAAHAYVTKLEEQLEALRDTVRKEVKFMDDRFPGIEDGSPVALVRESLRLALSDPAPKRSVFRRNREPQSWNDTSQAERDEWWGIA